MTPTGYEIRIEGHPDEHWTAWLGAADVVRHDDGTSTVVLGPVDQAGLHGVLAGLRDLGAPLISLRATG